MQIQITHIDDGDQARKVVLERLPEGAEVHSGKVILVVGSQKIVPDLETAFRRIRVQLLLFELLEFCLNFFR